MCVYAISDPATTASQLSNIYSIVALKFETVFQYGALVILLFLLLLAFSKAGSKKVSIASSPKYSFFSWSSMLFASGMGATILYWSPIEWSAYYNDPPFNLEVGSIEAVRTINAYTSFHWGFSGWAIYALSLIHI